MKKNIQNLLLKYKRIILYAMFGVATTIINILAYVVCARIFGFSTIVSTVLAWIIAVVFAYLTNRNLVFESNATGCKRVLYEIFSFLCCRILTGVLDILLMYILVDVLQFNDIYVKGFVNVLVVLLNYIASKIIIFKK